VFPKTDSSYKNIKSIGASEFAELVANDKKKILLIGVTDASREVYSILSEKGSEENITLWVDEKYNFFSLCGFPTVSCDSIQGKSFEVIALSGKRHIGFYERIAEKYGFGDLCAYMLRADGDNNVMNNCVPWRNIKYTDEVVNEENLLLIEPCELINEGRLDIVIRYMAGLEILNGIRGNATDMYIKLSRSMNDFSEYVRPYTTCAYFSAYESKKGEDEFLQSFKDLLESVKKNGFDKKHFIPLSESMGVINGTHRIAAALIFGEKVYAKKYIGFGEPFLTFDESDLKRLNYSEAEIKKIKDTFHRLKGGSFNENV